MPQDDLIDSIRKTGSDRYDPVRKQQFDEYYAPHDVHFFAETMEKQGLKAGIERMAREFPTKSASDRGQAVRPDIAIVYEASKCKMVKNVYPDIEKSDCYQFIGNPVDALIKVIKI